MAMGTSFLWTVNILGFSFFGFESEKHFIVRSDEIEVDGNTIKLHVHTDRCKYKRLLPRLNLQIVIVMNEILKFDWLTTEG